MDSELTELAQHECWDLLRSAEVGRLAVIVDVHPEIFPINYLVDHGTIVFRTADGSKLSAALGGGPVAFEIDGYDLDLDEAWSVVVKGAAREIRQLQELVDLAQLPLSPWHGSPKHRFVQIIPEELTGRRFRIVPAASWQTPLSGARRLVPE
jgi:nitroimidazol reductase NimA-like FMN-containing flavoprotein (pyridoxamine 5'-phosphate oxidase superfamily)